MSTSPAAAPSAQSPLRAFTDLPGPRRIPVFGNALQVDRTRFHQQLEGWAREFGPLYQLRFPSRSVLVVGDHAEVAKILRNRPEGFHRTSRLNEIWTEMGLPTGVFGANGETWKTQRRMVMAGFDPAHVKSYFPHQLKVCQRLVRRWERAAAEHAYIALQPDLMRYTVDIIAGLAFGAEVNTLSSDDDVIQQHLDQIFPALFRRILAPIPWWRWWPSAADKALKKSLIEVQAAVADFITKARTRIQQRPELAAHPENLLEAMIAAADAEGGALNDQQVAGNVLTMLLAGEDTTANTLAWMLHLLWTHPDALKRATEEVRQVLGEAREPALEHLASLDFIEACAHETMRLKPVAPMLPLQAAVDLQIADVAVPRGCTVVSLLRRDSVSEAHVPQAADFVPERWLQSGAPGHPAHLAAQAKRISMPFGAGPRICPGRYLALMEMKMAMATLLANFDIEDTSTADGEAPREFLNFTMAPLGLRMRLRERPATVS